MRFAGRLITWACGLILAGAALAQDPPKPFVQGQVIAAADVQRRLEEVASDAALSPELKTSLTEVLGRALEAAKAREAFQAAMDVLPSAEKVAADLASYREQMAAASDRQPDVLPTQIDLNEAELRLTAAQLALANAQAVVAEIEKMAVHRTTRRGEIPGRLAELRKALEALPQAVADESSDARLLAARRLRLAAERKRLEVEVEALQAEQQSYALREQLLTIRRDVAVRTVKQVQSTFDAWQERVQTLRSGAAAAAQQAAQQAERDARDSHPLLRELAAESAAIAAKVPPLLEKQRQVEQFISNAQKLREQLQAQLQDIKKRADGAGTTQTLSRMLREGRSKLPSVDRIFRREAGYDDTIVAEAYLASIEWEERRRQLTDDPQLVETLVETAEPPIVDPGQRDKIAGRARELIQQRLAMLATLSESSSEYLGRLQILESARQSARELVAEYRTFVNERVLWIRSSAAIWHLDVPAVGRAMAWFVSPKSWWSTGVAAASNGADDIWPFLFLALLLGALLLRGSWLRRLHYYGEVGNRKTNTHYAPTAMALLMTLLLAVPIPGILGLIGWLLGHASDAGEFGKSMSVGFLHAAVLLGIHSILRHVIRRGGLAEVHFGWTSAARLALRRNLWLLVPAALPLAMGLGALERHGDDVWLASLGRLLLLPFLLLVMELLRRLLHVRTGALVGGTTFLARFRGLWQLLAMAGLGGLIVMTILGFEYTVLQLARSIAYSVAILITFAIASSLVLRSLLLQRRRLSIQKARKAFEAKRAARALVETTHEDDEFDPETEPSDLDPTSIAKQTQALIRVAVVLGAISACLAVWAEVLPALGIFREVDLWTDSSTEPPIQITLADLLHAMVVGLLTVIAARNVPGLLELLVLQRLRIQSGERHAITTLARYLLVAIGVVTAFGVVGLGWSKVQFLIAAVSLGLGFGLQEIFANFVSGLILLFERPVRVGDWVQVGDWLGKVTRIKIRATTVRDLDNRELVVPNKEFVTGRFVNWTLSDSFVRLRLLVGVAYGSDTVLAKKLLVQAGAESEFVASSPAPRAMFLGFGDSALNLELRVYIEDYQQHATMLDDLHTSVDRLFRAHGIEISFPQRDLHLRTAKPLVEFLDRREVEE